MLNPNSIDAICHRLQSIRQIYGKSHSESKVCFKSKLSWQVERFWIFTVDSTANLRLIYDKSRKWSITFTLQISNLVLPNKPINSQSITQSSKRFIHNLLWFTSHHMQRHDCMHQLAWQQPPIVFITERLLKQTNKQYGRSDGRTHQNTSDSEMWHWARHYTHIRTCYYLGNQVSKSFVNSKVDNRKCWQT